jgi:hypothetical protein
MGQNAGTEAGCYGLRAFLREKYPQLTQLLIRRYQNSLQTRYKVILPHA